MNHAPLELTERGLYCDRGDFYVDPWAPVERAVITHAHADHASRGSKQYLTSREGQGVLQVRMGSEARIEAVEYGQTVSINGVKVSLHPAGHILGSAQVRVESQGRVMVVSGDYKVEPDRTCSPFEPVRCHTFLTESTFGLPIYRWPPQQEVFDQVNAWWRFNADSGRASLLMAYALGKAQRLLSGLDPSIGPIVAHGAVKPLWKAYLDAGIPLPEIRSVSEFPSKTDWSRALVIAPPSAQGSPWTRRFGALSSGFASGWMRIRGTRRRKALDRGFVLSDHADWPGLLAAIQATGAEEVWVTHGYSSVLSRWLEEQGTPARPLSTHFQGEDGAADEEPAGDNSESPS